MCRHHRLPGCSWCSSGCSVPSPPPWENMCVEQQIYLELRPALGGVGQNRGATARSSRPPPASASRSVAGAAVVLLALSRELGLALGLGLVVVETRVLELGVTRLMLEHLVTRTPPVAPIVRRSLGLLLIVGLRIVLVAAGV